jgi:hypothetical protein
MNITTCDACHLYPTHTLGTLCADCEAAAFAPANIDVELNAAWDEIIASDMLHLMGV